MGSFWAYARRLNEEIARKTAGAIVEFARENKADVIVFEHLEMKGRIRGKSRQKLHMWKKQTVQKVTEHQAHRLGMRISRVCAWKTSALAFDGSGKVVRDPRNHSLAVFQNGKQYNCDLSASYNIGARYFIREILKPVPATERSALEAKVPAVQRVDAGSPAGEDCCVQCSAVHMEYGTCPVAGMIRNGLRAKGYGLSSGDQVRLPTAACGESRIRKHVNLFMGGSLPGDKPGMTIIYMDRQIE